MVTREQFETLLNEDIFDTIPNAHEILGSPKGGFFSEHASWAVWKPENNEEGPVASSNDKSVLASYEVLEDKIHSDVIILALNSGIKFTSDKSELPWSTFHSGGRDYNLARALEDTPLSGAYITDLYKGMPTQSASDLKKFLSRLSESNRSRIDEAMRRIFEREMEILGASMNVPIITLGTDVSDYFSHIFKGTRNPVFANHYSKAMDRDFYSDQMNGIASGIF